MSGRTLGSKLREFKKTMHGTLDLLFFQQCASRGSLENLYSFRSVANFILCSPVSVGAPNSYYTALGRWLPDHPDATGREVAREIASEDRDYTVYTCVHGDRLDQLPRRLDEALKPLLNAPQLNPIAAADLPRAIYTSDDESTRDERTYFDQLTARDNAATQSLMDFHTWLYNSVISNVWYQKDAPLSRQREVQGLSLFVPSDAAEARRYRDMELYKDSSLGALWAKMFPR